MDVGINVKRDRDVVIYIHGVAPDKMHREAIRHDAPVNTFSEGGKVFTVTMFKIAGVEFRLFT